MLDGTQLLRRVRRVSGAARTPRRISFLAANPVFDRAVQFSAVQIIRIREDSSSPLG